MLTYAATQTLNATGFANVASSASFTAGYESAPQFNYIEQFDDVLLAGTWTSGTTPTAGTNALVYVIAVRDDDLAGSATWPDVFDGTGSAETATSAGVRQGYAKLAAALLVDTNTSSRIYDWGPVSVAALFGGNLPPRFDIFITHNTGVNSNSTTGNFALKYTGVTYS